MFPTIQTDSDTWVTQRAIEDRRRYPEPAIVVRSRTMSIYYMLLSDLLDRLAE